MAFADNARITLAKALLRDSMPITDVAQAAGLAIKSHFHKAFTAYTHHARSISKPDQF